MRVDENKTELFKYIADRVTDKIDTHEKVVVCTYDETVLTVPDTKDISRLSPCSQEEADGRIFLHVADCKESGHQKIQIRTTDTDVVVLAVSFWQALEVKELWIALGVGKHFQWVPCHTIAKHLGPKQSTALPAFHAMTSSDVKSFFAGRGKKTAWTTWSVCPQATDAFLQMMEQPLQSVSDIAADLEHFVVLLYDRTSECISVNDARHDLFARGNRQIENIPPTKASLHQHILRAVYVSSYIWGQSLQKQPNIPSPANWGWQKDEAGKAWRPIWTTLPQAQDVCRELIRCGCKLTCKGRCKCTKANLQCTALCACGGDCNRD